jgi:hypothetical protein
MDDSYDRDDAWAHDQDHAHDGQYAHAHVAGAHVATAAAGSSAAAAAARCPRCSEPLGDEVLEVDGFLACGACGFVLDDSILVHTLFAPASEDGAGAGTTGRDHQVQVGVRVWHDDPTGSSAVARELRRGAASGAVGREASSHAAGREARRRRLHARLRAIMAALPPAAAAMPRRAAADNAAALLDRVDAAYHPSLSSSHGVPLATRGEPEEQEQQQHHQVRAETLAAVAYVTAREAGAPITFAAVAGAAACAPLSVAREFLRIKQVLRLTVPQAPLSTLILTQGATLLRIARRGRGPSTTSVVVAPLGTATAATATNLPPPPLPPSTLPTPANGASTEQQQQQQQQQVVVLLPPPTRSAAGGLACRDRPSAVIAAASLAAANRDLARERALHPDPLSTAPAARRVAAHPAVASALDLAELLQAVGVAETRRRDAVAAACLKLCIGATAPKRGHAPLRRLSVAEVVDALGVSTKAVGGAVRAAQAELRRMVPLLPFPVRFSDAAAHAGLLLRLHRLACKATPMMTAPPAAPALAQLPPPPPQLLMGQEGEA